MAITKIAGELLESNLIRTTDLAFNTNLLVVDVDNGRIGVGTATPGNFKLTLLVIQEFQEIKLLQVTLQFKETLLQ